MEEIEMEVMAIEEIELSSSIPSLASFSQGPVESSTATANSQLESDNTPPTLTVACVQRRAGTAPHQVVRRWRRHPGRNKFYCDGRLMAPNSRGLLFFITSIILCVSVLFFAHDGPYLAVNVSPAIPVTGGLLFFFVLAYLARVVLSDPGIIPRATKHETEAIESLITQSSGQRPRTRVIEVRGVAVKLKYCYTCKIFRPPRASHCSTCDNCVDGFDHHCPWVGNCIGRRNYRYFYFFILFLFWLCTFITISAISRLALEAHQSNMANAMLKTPQTCFVIVICSFAAWMLVTLYGYHTYLVLFNLTTREDIRIFYSQNDDNVQIVNPYSRGTPTANLVGILCGPQFPSLIRPRSFVEDDEEGEARENITEC